MECSLAALIACFSWSNLYIDTSLSYLDVKQIYPHWEETINQRVNRSEYLSPYGGLALGFSLPIQEVTLSLEASHVSSLATSHDRGINAVSLRARWFPFR